MRPRTTGGSIAGLAVDSWTGASASRATNSTRVSSGSRRASGCGVTTEPWDTTCKRRTWSRRFDQAISLIQPRRRSLLASTSAALRNDDSTSARYSIARRNPSFVGVLTSMPARVSCWRTIGIAASWPPMNSQKSTMIWSVTAMNGFHVSSTASRFETFASASAIMAFASPRNPASTLRPVFAELPAGLGEVHFVCDEDDRDRVSHGEQMRDPILVEALGRLRASHVVDQERAFRPLERTLLDPPVSLLAQDVPDHERHVGRLAGRLDPQVFLRDFRADRRDVIVRELVDHEASNEARLAHGAVAEEQDLSLDVVIDHDGLAPCRGHSYNAC